ncbi:hypothetical protein JY651_03775 [Pyxidicoccus parkwayensis]|uniref:Lipoprotein n=1 Tax=Pyxidicoccus parkwayensis TaxID=2813578 RepID=A0ABX7P1U0_9BACT|nr:hypothetical protein [Pyxidicoccus parkwaysis]QSQ24106.1 hypothetical protein JY651_03775 [Pyxidicoccus parkwaysis]
MSKSVLSLAVLVASCVISACSTPGGQTAASINAREVNIVDEQGQVRLRLGAPLPPPKGAGGRKVKAYGIQFIGSEGQEVGGLGVLEPMGMRAFCFDTDEWVEALCFSVDKGQPELRLGDASAQRISLRVRDGVATLELMDSQGTPRLKLEVDNDGKTHVEGVTPASVSR